MFLSKDVFGDEESPQKGAPAPAGMPQMGVAGAMGVGAMGVGAMGARPMGGPPARGPMGGMGGMGGLGGLRPATTGYPTGGASAARAADGRPTSAPAPDEGDQVLNAGAMREKMLAQRRSMQAKHAQRRQQGAAPVVAASAGLQTAPNAGTPSSLRGNLAGGLLSPKEGQEEKEEARREDRDNADVVPVFEEPDKVAAVADALMEQGISTVFDPKPKSGNLHLMDLQSLDQAQLREFLLSPVPKNMELQCRVIRDRSGMNKLFPKYILQTEAGQVLLISKKRTKNKTSNYFITMSTDSKFDKEDDGFVAKLRSNFVGSEFVVYGRGLNPKHVPADWTPGRKFAAVRSEMAVVTYMSTLWGKKPRGPREVRVVLPHVTANGETMESRPMKDGEGLMEVARSGNVTNRQQADLYRNKPPRWEERIGAFVLNFNKRVTLASVKNFQLVSMDDPDVVYLQFGRAGKEIFSMDVRYPLTPVQAFGISLSSFDYKLCCE